MKKSELIKLIREEFQPLLNQLWGVKIKNDEVFIYDLPITSVKNDIIYFNIKFKTRTQTHQRNRIHISQLNIYNYYTDMVICDSYENAIKQAEIHVNKLIDKYQDEINWLSKKQEKLQIQIENL